MSSTYTEWVKALNMLVDVTSAQGEPGCPTWVEDQIRAAAIDTHAQFLYVVSGSNILRPGVFGAVGEDRDVRHQVRWLAAVAECRPCFHLRARSGPQPSWADLNHRLLLCRRCMATHRRPVDDGRCEICGTPGHVEFREAVAQLGHVVMVGHVGSCCYDLLSIEAT